MNFRKIAAAALAMGVSAFAADVVDNMTRKGNVQTQVTKSIADEDNNFSSGWIRGNIGGQYKSDNLDGTIMLRIFAPEFGNKNVTDVSTDADGKLYNLYGQQVATPSKGVYVKRNKKVVIK